PCLEEPRRAWPSTPSSVCTVTTPRSLLPPKDPVPVRHASLFQLNMVTLTSVIFTSNLLITRVVTLPVWRHHSRNAGYVTRGDRNAPGSGGQHEEGGRMHAGSAAMCCHAFGTIGARGSSIQSRTQGVGGQGIRRYSRYRGRPSDWIGGSYAVTVSR